MSSVQDSHLPKVKIACIGGSGLYNLEAFELLEDREISTPFGAPSDKIRIGTLAGQSIAFLPRHGRHHSYLPAEVPHRANIHALKQLGVEWIISISAVGSLKEEKAPGHVVLPDQFVDRTKGRAPCTFFGRGIVAHIAFAHPISASLQGALYDAAVEVGANVHKGGTYVNMEGPQFSTLAESNTYRASGYDIIGMTNVVEAKLAREAEIAYATMAMVTDYDCWHPDHDSVTVEYVIGWLRKNTALSQQILISAIPKIAALPPCSSHTALKNAILTPPAHWPQETATKLEALIGKYRA
ncbi:MAG: S-methyl-5'-thioadenosine phosphorylase [Candidatus Methylacidiphilales bacterium]|nr:S-methyl-5'-thioadenosine phosphorylase [Candidatus Methylacidiphilales bacterium]